MSFRLVVVPVCVLAASMLGFGQQQRPTFKYVSADGKQTSMGYLEVADKGVSEKIYFWTETDMQIELDLQKVSSITLTARKRSENQCSQWNTSQTLVAFQDGSKVEGCLGPSHVAFIASNYKISSVGHSKGQFTRVER